MNITCKNCGAVVHGNFCAHCGQKATVGRLKVTHVVGEFWHNFTHTDKGYISFIAAMVKNPGVVIREYIGAHRKKYFNPYTFYLVTTAILIFVTAKVFAYEDKLYNYRNEFGQLINEKYNLMVLCCLPFLAFVLMGLFRKKKYNYAEWVTFLIFAYGLINFVNIFIQLFYFPFIKYHYNAKGFTDLIPYFIMLYILVRFIQPKKWFEWTEVILGISIIFLITELIAPLILLGIYGVPFSQLTEMFKKFFLRNDSYSF